jgi:pimeloyl-ACP methyl ester carboxylesterase
VAHHTEMEHWTKDLSRPGRLTAAMNWYRANLLKLYMASDFPNVSIPVMGVWSTEDIAVAEDQMVNSERYVDNSFRYERFENCSHWIPLDEPQRVVSTVLDFFEQQKTTE